MMPGRIPERFDDVSVICKANVYYDGQVVSYTVLFKDGKIMRIGVICPGIYRFRTDDLEKMDITAGTCRVRQADEGQWVTYHAGSSFVVPGWSYFEIAVDKGVVEYISSFESHLNKKAYVYKEYPSVDRK
jgi:uncharacterized protein YaiE (UPF0345 family)